MAGGGSAAGVVLARCLSVVFFSRRWCEAALLLGQRVTGMSAQRELLHVAVLRCRPRCVRLAAAQSGRLAIDLDGRQWNGVNAGLFKANHACDAMLLGSFFPCRDSSVRHVVDNPRVSSPRVLPCSLGRCRQWSRFCVPRDRHTHERCYNSACFIEDRSTDTHRIDVASEQAVSNSVRTS